MCIKHWKKHRKRQQEMELPALPHCACQPCRGAAAAFRSPQALHRASNSGPARFCLDSSWPAQSRAVAHLAVTAIV